MAPAGMTASERLGRLDGEMDECWDWPGRLNNGYGRIRQRPTVLAHRAMYALYHDCELTSADIVHHRCENPACMNPRHLERTTRGRHSQFHLPTHCSVGHEFTPENTYVRKGDGRRACRKCANRRHREMWAQSEARRERQNAGRRASRARK